MINYTVNFFNVEVSANKPYNNSCFIIVCVSVYYRPLIYYHVTENDEKVDRTCIVKKNLNLEMNMKRSVKNVSFN